MKLSENLYLAKKAWAEKVRIASEKEELRKPVLASVYNQMRNDTSSSQKDCEMQAYDSQQYRNHINKMVLAREEANIAFAHVEGCREKIKEEEREDIKESMRIKYSSGVGG